MIKTNKGFTFVELLVVITIIGVLAGLLYLMMGPSGDMAKKKACFGNRTTIMLALETYRYAEGKNKTDYSLQDFIDAKYEDTMSTENAKCPSNGIYSEGEENGREVVLCSVHYPTPGAGDEPGGGDTPGGGTGNYLPGTESFGNPGISPNSTWPTPIYDTTGTVVTNKVTFPKGSSFSYVKNGVTEYYVVINDNGIVFGRNKDAVTPDYTWGYGEIAKVSTKPVVTWSDVVANNLQILTGEIVYDDTSSPGKYYISRQNYINKNTPIGTGNWVEIK